MIANSYINIRKTFSSLNNHVFIKCCYCKNAKYFLYKPIIFKIKAKHIEPQPKIQYALKKEHILRSLGNT